MTKKELKKLVNEFYSTPVNEMEDFVATVFREKFNSNPRKIGVLFDGIAKDASFSLRSEVRDKMLDILWGSDDYNI